MNPRPVMPPPRIIYAGSVTVNAGNNRFFEPAPGRNWVIGVRAAQMF
jgi:iron complex outermembrane receptor protein